MAGWFFEPRPATLRLDGRGTPSLELSVPPIRIDRLMVGDAELSLAFDHLVIVGAPIQIGFDGPRLTLRGGRRFPRGHGNVVVEGLLGFTEPDGTAVGRTPRTIRRACMLLTLRTLALLADDAAFEARSRWRVIEERTRDQTCKLDRAAPSSLTLVGDPEIDGLLAPHVRPSPLGSA